MRAIYYYFRDVKTGRCLNQKIVDELFFKHLSSDVEEDFKLAYGNNYKNYVEPNDKFIRRRLSTRITRFKQKLENLTNQDIYTMNPQDVINLYYQKYHHGIYVYFKNSQTGQYLNPQVIDELFLNNLSSEDKEDLTIAFGPNYLEHIDTVNHTYNKSVRNRVLTRTCRFKKKMEAVSNENIYDMEPQKLIALYYQRYPKGIYKKFPANKTGEYLEPLIINTLFIKNLNSNQKELVELVYGKDYQDDKSSEYPEQSKKIGIIIFHFIRKLKSLTDKDIYEMNSQELIDLYHQKYPKGIYQIFRKNNKFLNPEIVDIIFLTNMEPHIYEMCLKTFDNYLENIKICNNYSFKKYIYHHFYYQQRLIENKIGYDLYDNSKETIIKAYFVNFPKAIINSDYLLTSPYLLAIYKQKLLKYNFYRKISNTYNEELALIIYLYFGKELSRRLEVEEIAKLLNKPLDITIANLEKIKDILRNLNEKRIVVKTRKKG